MWCWGTDRDVPTPGRAAQLLPLRELQVGRVVNDHGRFAVHHLSLQAEAEQRQWEKERKVREP